MAPCLYYTGKPVCSGEARTVTGRVAGALSGAGWVGLCGCGLYFRCEEIVVPCSKLADMSGLLKQKSMSFSYLLLQSLGSSPGRACPNVQRISP